MGDRPCGKNLLLQKEIGGGHCVIRRFLNPECMPKISGPPIKVLIVIFAFLIIFGSVFFASLAAISENFVHVASSSANDSFKDAAIQEEVGLKAKGGYNKVNRRVNRPPKAKVSKDSVSIQKHIKPPKLPIQQKKRRQFYYDDQILLSGNEPSNERQPYPKRTNMGPCAPIFGKIGIFVAYRLEEYQKKYKIAQESLQCYAKSTNYSLVLVDLYNDPRIQEHCPHTEIFFRKHCAASVYLQDFDWMMVLDADTAVVNPNHCIEEWIDDRVDLVFYERYFNFEIMSGNYLARNTMFARDFLMKWADWQYKKPPSWNGADNGVLQMHILQTVLPGARAEIRACDEIYRRATGYDSYMAYVTCVKLALGASRVFPRKLRIFRRGHGFARDGFLASDSWCEVDFMFHGYKQMAIGENNWESPYQKDFEPDKCGRGYAGWAWRESKRLTCDDIRKRLASFERGSWKSFPAEGRVLPHLVEPEVGNCWPTCDIHT